MARSCSRETPGYVIEAQAEQIDSVRFEKMVGEGRALADVDPAAASLVLGESLALWRGRAFEEFTYESFAQAEIARLEGLRLEAVELRLDADLQRGLSRELISELESLVRQYPLREHMTAQLMLALYRSSRQADALRAYQVLNSRLGEELGIEASSGLRTLRDQIVTGDEALEIRSRAPVRGRSDVPSPAVRGYELREQIRASAVGPLTARTSPPWAVRWRSPSSVPTSPTILRSSVVSKAKHRSSRPWSIRTSSRCTTIGVSPTRPISSCG